MRTITVATFNTHFGIGPDGKPYDVDAVIRCLDADVVVLQEVWLPLDRMDNAGGPGHGQGYRMHVSSLASAALANGPRLLTSPDGAEGEWGVVVLSRFEQRLVRLIPLGRKGNDPVDRKAIVLELDVADRPVVFVAAHLSFYPWHAARQLRRIALEVGNVARPTILAGDLNLWSRAVTAVLPGWRRGRSRATWPAPRPHSQLDHILGAGGAVPIDVTVPRLGSSDHYPVRAVVQLG